MEQNRLPSTFHTPHASNAKANIALWPINRAARKLCSSEALKLTLLVSKAKQTRDLTRPGMDQERAREKETS
ncbi:hypothetical protein ACLKA7_014685 [Drosophila subpalustris]